MNELQWCPKCNAHQIDPRHGDVCPVCAGEAGQAASSFWGAR